MLELILIKRKGFVENILVTLFIIIMMENWFWKHSNFELAHDESFFNIEYEFLLI